MRGEAPRGEGSQGGPRTPLRVVELAEEQLSVGPIHRLVTGLGPDDDLLSTLEAFFEIEPIDLPSTGIIAELEATGSLALITQNGASLLRPRAEMFGETRDLDSSRLDLALEGLDGITVSYQHGVDNILAAAATSDRCPDRGDRPRWRADAPEEHLLLPEAAHRRGAAEPSRLISGAERDDQEAPLSPAGLPRRRELPTSRPGRGPDPTYTEDRERGWLRRAR